MSLNLLVFTAIINHFKQGIGSLHQEMCHWSTE